MMFRPMHIDIGILHDLTGNFDGILQICGQTEGTNSLQPFFLMAGIADKVSVLTTGIGQKCLMTDGAFHLSCVFRVNQFFAAD